MPPGLKDLVVVGGATTVMLADAVPPVPPSVEVTAPVVLFCVPAAMPVTLTDKLQDAVAARVPPDKLITLVPCVAVIVPVHVVVRPLGVEMISPAGSVSLNPMPVRVLELFGLLRVKVSNVLPFSGMLVAPNALLMVGGEITVMDALDVLPVPPLVDVTCTELFFAPDVVPCTVTETVHDAPAPRLAPVSVTEDDPFAAVAVPPQVLFRLPGVATTRPAGRLSVNATPFRVKLVFVLLRVNVRLVVPFSGMVAAPNALAMVGALITVRFAEDVLPLPASAELIVTLLL